MLPLMKYLHYWIDLEKARIRKVAMFWKQPLDNILFKMWYIKVHSYR